MAQGSESVAGWALAGRGVVSAPKISNSATAHMPTCTHAPTATPPFHGHGHALWAQKALHDCGLTADARPISTTSGQAHQTDATSTMPCPTLFTSASAPVRGL